MNSYPEPVEALGFSGALYYPLYPQLYTEKRTCGATLFISKRGNYSMWTEWSELLLLTGLSSFIGVIIHDFAELVMK